MSVETTRSSLIKSMLRLIRERRFSAIRIEDICEKTHISRRTFYRYYADKYALLKDVYIECFFSKIMISEQDDFWDIFAKICEQIYSDKMFFQHAFEVKGQNGFQDEAGSILTPYYMREAPSYDYLDKMKLYFVKTDLDRLFHLIEIWIGSGMKHTAKQFTDFVRANYYIYGQWTYQLAAGQERTHFSKDVLLDFNEYLKKNAVDTSSK